MTLSELQAKEAECLNTFRAKKRKLLAENPGMLPSEALQTAFTSLPVTMQTYRRVVAKIKAEGVMPATFIS